MEVEAGLKAQDLADLIRVCEEVSLAWARLDRA